MIALEIKEMPLEEKYERLFDRYALAVATSYALHKELGVVDKSHDFSVKVMKKMLPSLAGVVFKVAKAISPGKAFKKAVDQYLYAIQAVNPLSNIEITWVSDREVVFRVKNCLVLKRVRDMVKKAGLDMDPKFFCDDDRKLSIEVLKEFGIDLAMELEENGCRGTAKLK